MLSSQTFSRINPVVPFHLKCIQINWFPVAQFSGILFVCLLPFEAHSSLTLILDVVNLLLCLSRNVFSLDLNGAVFRRIILVFAAVRHTFIVNAAVIWIWIVLLMLLLLLPKNTVFARDWQGTSGIGRSSTTSAWLFDWIHKCFIATQWPLKNGGRWS